ncbi:MAG: thioredoxin [Rhodospirillaceae bacterium]|nr:thioredoxin [Rhodospirillaceae bacterium]
MTAILDGDGTEAEITQPVSGPAGGAAGDGGLIIESDTERFAEDVINASAQVPVIVDFWAPWCEPCKQLTPILEKLVTEYGGQVKLVKVNIDDNQALAQQLRVQSIPMVYAFKDGRPADAFNGVIPESQLRQFIEKLTGGAGSPIDQAMEQANGLMAAGDPTTASAIFNQILAQDSLNADAHAGILKCLMAEGEMDQARNYLAGLTEELLTTQPISAVQTALELEEQTADSGEADELKAAVEANPDDHQARYDYALALYGGGQAETAIEELVEILKRNQSWNEDAAKAQLLKIFEALGHADPITVEGRRKMSAVLFS